MYLCIRKYFLTHFDFKNYQVKLYFIVFLHFISAHQRKEKKSTMSKRLKRSRLELESLPDEILLQIFSYIDFQELLQCGQVSKRIRTICSDKSFWEDIFLSRKKVKAEFIKSILDRNCDSLSIKNTVIDGCVKLNRPSKLKRLDLYCNASKDFFHEILNSCSSLEFLEISCEYSLNVVLQNLCKRNSQTLTSLSLGEYKLISKNSIQVILKHCTQLIQIDLWDSNMSEDSMDFFVNNLSPNVKRISLSSNTENMKDRHIETLVSRCNRITKLDLSDTKLTDTSIASVIQHLKQSLVCLQVEEATEISFEKVLELKSMPKLQILKYGFKSWHTMYLRGYLPHLKINEDDFGYF